MNPLRKVLPALALIALLTAACAPAAPAESDRLLVVATTSIVGDVVAQVGGELVEVRVLLPLGTDPHAFQPRPQDAALLAGADLVFANGAGLEEFLAPLLESAGASDKLVDLSAGIVLLPLAFGDDEHGGGDPHTAFAPFNVMTWSANAADALIALDPVHADEYRANGIAYNTELRALHEWIALTVNDLPPERRVLVTDHAVLGYFARAYGFSQAGALIASFSTSAAPSAQELAGLEDQIRGLGIPAVFVSQEVNPVLAEQVARDTGAQLVRLYTHSLSAADGPAGTYIDLMHYNVQAIVDALKVP